MEEGKVEYLGDGLYAVKEDGQVKVYASDGINVSNEVYVDSSVAESLIRFLQRAYPRI